MVTRFCYNLKFIVRELAMIVLIHLLILNMGILLRKLLVDLLLTKIMK